MQRYDIEETLMEKRAEGEYVKFADHQAALDAVVAEAVWAMETIRELIMLKLDRKNQTWAELEKECLAHPYYQHAKRFLDRSDVCEWLERLK